MKTTMRPVVDRLAFPRQRTKYKGEGLCLGAEVTAHTEIGQFTGQVWAQAPRPECWWVISATGHAWLLHESEIEVIGQALHDSDAIAA